MSRIGLGEDTAVFADFVRPDERITAETLRRRKLLLDRLLQQTLEQPSEKLAVSLIVISAYSNSSIVQ